MLVRVGTRGSRLALTQAGSLAERLRGAWGRDCAASDHDNGRPRPPLAVRGDRRPRRVRQGAGGGAARRPHRRRRPLGEGHDVDRRGGTGGRRLPDARGPSRRARRRRDDRAGNADRHGVRTAHGAAARAGAVAVRRAAARERRHAAQEASRARSRRDRARRLRSRPSRSRLGDRLQARARRDAARGGPGSAGLAGACRRGGARGATRRRRDPPARRGRARPVWRRSAVAASRLSPRITTGAS